MISVVFIFEKNFIIGYKVSGHSGHKKHGHDIICAAVSSAAYMTVNAITEILCANAFTSIKDGYMYVKIASQDADLCSLVFQSFKLHIKALCKQYGNFINFKNVFLSM